MPHLPERSPVSAGPGFSREPHPWLRLFVLISAMAGMLALLAAPEPVSAGSRGAQADSAKGIAKAKARKVKPRKAVSNASTNGKAAKSRRTVTGKPSAKSRKVRARSTAARRATTVRARRPTLAAAFGLNETDDPAGLRSSVAYVLDVDSDRVLLEKNAGQVLPIASITKLMTVMVVLDADQPMREMIRITREDIDRERHSSSRLPVGTRLSRRELIKLALMASANRAAHALGRQYPGGLTAFVSAMNAKARLLGLMDTRFADPTGLSGANVSSARDLARLLKAAAEYAVIREDSTLEGLSVDTGYRVQRFANTNLLVQDEGWEIDVQKTGFISEAGRCLVMLTRIDGRQLAMVFLASNGKYTRIADARRVRKWLQTNGAVTAMVSTQSVAAN